jgi:hypothetical protein
MFREGHISAREPDDQRGDAGNPEVPLIPARALKCHAGRRSFKKKLATSAIAFPEATFDMPEIY